jgi:hypothetical protein
MTTYKKEKEYTEAQPKKKPSGKKLGVPGWKKIKALRGGGKAFYKGGKV